MFGYSNDLRSMTQGKGSFSMEFLKYQKLPSRFQEEIVKKAAEPPRRPPRPDPVRAGAPRHTTPGPAEIPPAGPGVAAHRPAVDGSTGAHDKGAASPPSSSPVRESDTTDSRPNRRTCACPRPTPMFRAPRARGRSRRRPGPTGPQAVADAAEAGLARRRGGLARAGRLPGGVALVRVHRARAPRRPASAARSSSATRASRPSIPSPACRATGTGPTPRGSTSGGAGGGPGPPLVPRRPRRARPVADLRPAGEGRHPGDRPPAGRARRR